MAKKQRLSQAERRRRSIQARINFGLRGRVATRLRGKRGGRLPGETRYGDPKQFPISPWTGYGFENSAGDVPAPTELTQGDQILYEGGSRQNESAIRARRAMSERLNLYVPGRAMAPGNVSSR